MFLTAVILVNPVAVVQTVSLIFSFDWMNAVALVVILVGSMVIELILIHIHDGQVWEEKSSAVISTTLMTSFSSQPRLRI